LGQLQVEDGAHNNPPDDDDDTEQQALRAELQQYIDSPENFEEQQSEASMAGTSLPALEIPMSGGNRASPSPTSSVAGAQQNGTAAAAYAAPLPAGHQQDLQYLYSQIQELSAILKSNREKTATLSKAAEEIGVCQHLLIYIVCSQLTCINSAVHKSMVCDLRVRTKALFRPTVRPALSEIAHRPLTNGRSTHPRARTRNAQQSLPHRSIQARTA
jgi:hypothetical protein